MSLTALELVDSPRKQAQGSASSDKILLDALLAHAVHGMYLVDEDGICTAWSHSMELMTGITAGRATGRAIEDVWSTLSQTAAPAHGKSMRGEHFLLPDLRLQTAEHQRNYCDLTLTPILDGEKVTAVLGTAVDVTNRVHARDELKRLHAAADTEARRFQAAMDTLPTAALIIRSDGVIQHYNRQAATLAPQLVPGSTVSLEMLAPSEPWFTVLRILCQPEPQKDLIEHDVSDLLSGRRWSITIRTFPALDPERRERLVMCREAGGAESVPAALAEQAQAVSAEQVSSPNLDFVPPRRTSPRAAKPVLPQTSDEPDPFLGSSREIQKLRGDARKVLKDDSPILIEGETGSGKNVLANWLHRNGRRNKGAFVNLNCAGLSPELLETELFGHHKGAFTGAFADKEGLLTVADGGTLFLDEVGDTSPAVQGKLLKVVEEKKYRRLGDVRERTTNMRLICATNRDLRALVERQEFRIDLFHRLWVLPLRIPPLRERRDDIPALANCLLNRILAVCDAEKQVLDGSLLTVLQQYSWPGNIREMENVLRRAVVLADGGRLRMEHLIFERIVSSPGAEPAGERPMTLKEAEGLRIEAVLQKEPSVARAARTLGISRSSLYEKLKAMQPA